MSVKLLLSSTNTKLFVRNKSCSTLQLIKGISRDLERFLRYLSGIVTSAFRDDTSACSGWSASPGFPGYGGISGISPNISVL